MLFIVLSIILIAVIVWWVVITIKSDLFESRITPFISAFFEVVICVPLALLTAFGVSWGVANWVTDYTFKEDTSVDLIALTAHDTIEGQFYGSIFASYGYVNGVRVLSYATKFDDGGISLGYVDVGITLVYEGEDDPHMDTHHWVKENGWFLPGGVFDSAETYSLYVPTGSVVQEFNVET